LLLAFPSCRPPPLFLVGLLFSFPSCPPPPLFTRKSGGGRQERNANKSTRKSGGGRQEGNANNKPTRKSGGGRQEGNANNRIQPQKFPIDFSICEISYTI
jgi:hypothetical protein